MDNAEEKMQDVIGHQLQLIDIKVIDGIDNGIPPPLEYDASIDEKLPETVTLLTTPEGGKLYLVGTAHFSAESQNDVSMIIQAVQPHIVVVELCKARIDVIYCNEDVLYQNATNLNFQSLKEILKEYGPYNGLFHVILYRVVAHIVKELGMPPGGEFRTAFEEAKKIPNCVVQLADRSINITLQRALRELSWKEIIKLVWFMTHINDQFSKQDVERYKRKSEVEQMIELLKIHYPAIGRIFVTERDLYLTYHLQVAAAARITSEQSKPPRVVGVVGIGHMNGIVENWGKVKVSDIWPIMQVPPQPLSTKILKFTFKASVMGAVIYIGYKVVSLSSGNIYHSIRSSIEGLLKAKPCRDDYYHAIPGVVYVTQNIPGPGIDIDEFESEYLAGCSCTCICSDCTCTRGSSNYISGRILNEKSVGPIIECNSHCKCNKDCGNRVVQDGPLDCLVVSEIDKKGFGLFTNKIIRKGQFICEYSGELIGMEEAKRRIDANKNYMNYVLVVSEYIGEHAIVTCIDPQYFGNIGRYVNHSCEPNANLIPVRIEGLIPRLCIFAIRDIEIGEEITFNYADGVANSVHSDTPCLCGVYNCSGYLPHNSI